MSRKGWQDGRHWKRPVNYIPDTHFKIADAKRGDIGNTATQYAIAFLKNLPFDAITIAPYMGEDSVKPFLQFEDKWGIVLGLTSNPGAADFELKELNGGESFIRKSDSHRCRLGLNREPDVCCRCNKVRRVHQPQSNIA